MKIQNTLNLLTTRSSDTSKNRTAIILFFISFIVILGTGCAKVTEGIEALQNSDGTTDESLKLDGLEIDESDVQFIAFKTALYPTLSNRCGGCHATFAKPSFANENPAKAFSIINNRSLINMRAPEKSTLVNRPLSLHECSQPNCDTIANEIKRGIENFATLLDGAETVTPNTADENNGTSPPSPIDSSTLTGVDLGTDNSSSSAEHVSAFKTNLYPVLVDQCGRCHTSLVTRKFAHENIETAYSIVVANTLVNLSNPSNSRLVKRPLNKHGCIPTDCQAWSDNIKTGIEGWASEVVGSIAGAGINGASIVSKALLISDGKKDEGAGRIEDAVIAKYEFKAGAGLIAYDTSGVIPALNLTLTDHVIWLPSKGVEITDPDNDRRTKLIAGAGTSSKLYKRIADSNGTKQFTIETWIINESTALDGPARIVNYSINSGSRNFTMGQDTTYYSFRNRSDKTGNNGTSPVLESDNDSDDLKTQLQHVVFTFDEENGRNIYVNGIKTAYEGVKRDTAVPARLFTWDQDAIFSLGNESNNSRRQWLGKMLFVAIHERALTADEIIRNTLEGIGDRFILEFDITHLLDASASTSSKIRVVVSELDDYSYVFGTPTLITNMPAPNIPVRNLRIAVNGNIPAAAQAFKNIDLAAITDVTELSPLGSVIPKDQGPETDKFSLVFEQLGNNINVVVEQNPVFVEDMSVNPPSYEFGMRTFDQINNTMAVLTGVDQAIVSDTFLKLKEQLPSIPNLEGFVSSNQIGIAKLSLEYCDAFVEDTTLRNNFFGNTFEFNSPVATAFSDQTKRDIIISNVVNKFAGTNLSAQPSLAEIQPDIDQLIDELSVNCTLDADCDSTRTRTIVKAVCASVLASAVISIE